MITRLRLQNFRNHAQTEMSLGPISLLVGPAGAGKSNVLKALFFIQMSVLHELAEMFPPGPGEFHLVRSRWAGATDPISVELDIDEVMDYPALTFRYHLAIADSPAGLYVLAESLQWRSDEGIWNWVFQRPSRNIFLGEFGDVDAYGPSVLCKAQRVDVAAPDAPNVKMAQAVARTLLSMQHYHLQAMRLKTMGIGQAATRLDYLGGRLPDFLGWLKSTPEHAAAAAYQTIREGLLELLPDVQSMLITQVGPDRQGLSLSFKGHKDAIAAPDLSDGTMLTLGLLSVLHGPSRPALLCIEEPEDGLHPRRLRWLFDRMISIAYPEPGQPRTQVLLTTHSPDLVDLFSDMPEAVQVVDQVTGPTGHRQSRVTPLPDILAKLHKQGGKVESIGHAWATGLYEQL
jgi:hypothetical protein